MIASGMQNRSSGCCTVHHCRLCCCGSPRALPTLTTRVGLCNVQAPTSGMRFLTQRLAAKDAPASGGWVTRSLLT